MGRDRFAHPVALGRPGGGAVSERLMNDFTLVIGNKNYSSWSLRAWLAMRRVGVPFREILVPLYGDGWRDAIRVHSPAGKVPVLKHGDLTVWDTLAIFEYLAERFPAARLWPADTTARAIARAVTAEMHSGFAALRGAMPMNLRRSIPGRGQDAATAADIARVCEIWRDCRERFGAAGAFLFGDFSAADAAFAPVAARFATYDVALDDVSAAYRDAVLGLPDMNDWYAAARSEPWTIEEDEVD